MKKKPIAVAVAAASSSTASSFDVEGWVAQMKQPCPDSWLYCSGNCTHERYVASDRLGNDDMIWDEKETRTPVITNAIIDSSSYASASSSSASLLDGLRLIGLLALPSAYRYDRIEENRLEKRDKKAAKEAKATSIIPKGDLLKKYNKWTPDSRKKLYQPKKPSAGRGQNPALRQLVVDAGGIDPLEAVKKGQIYKGPRLPAATFESRTFTSPSAAAAARARGTGGATGNTPQVTVVSAGALQRQQRPDEEDDEYGDEYWDDAEGDYDPYEGDEYYDDYYAHAANGTFGDFIDADETVITHGVPSAPPSNWATSEDQELMAAMQLSMIEEKIHHGDYSFLNDASSITVASSSSSSSSLAELKGEHKNRVSVSLPGLKADEAIIATGEFRASMDIGTTVYVILSSDEYTRRETRGVIKTIFTEKPFHDQGIKVMLTIGEIGRVTKVIGSVTAIEPGAPLPSSSSTSSTITTSIGASSFLPSSGARTGGMAASISQFVPQSIMMIQKVHDPTKRPTNVGQSLMDFVVDKRKPRKGKRHGGASGSVATAATVIQGEPGDDDDGIAVAVASSSVAHVSHQQRDEGQIDDLAAAIEASRISAAAEHAMAMNLPVSSSLSSSSRREGEVDTREHKGERPAPPGLSIPTKKGITAGKPAVSSTPATAKRAPPSNDGMRVLLPKSNTYTIASSSALRNSNNNSASLAAARNASFGEGMTLRPVSKAPSSFVATPTPAKVAAKKVVTASVAAPAKAAATATPTVEMQSCPICNKRVSVATINTHIDECLSLTALAEAQDAAALHDDDHYNHDDHDHDHDDDEGEYDEDDDEPVVAAPSKRPSAAPSSAAFASRRGRR